MFRKCSGVKVFGYVKTQDTYRYSQQYLSFEMKYFHFVALQHGGVCTHLGNEYTVVRFHIHNKHFKRLRQHILSKHTSFKVTLILFN